MVIGGCGGGALGLFLHWLRPWLAPQPATFVIVGMAGFFAAAAQNTLLNHRDRQRNDGQLRPVASHVVGLHGDISPVRRAIDLQLASRKPLPVGRPTKAITSAMC